MPEVQNILDTIKAVIEQILNFFKELGGMFKKPEDEEAAE